MCRWSPCSPWEYNETGNECFREICHEDELLFVEANAPYHIAYEYNNGFAEPLLPALEGGEEMSIETGEYSDVFDENEGACYRYVICGVKLSIPKMPESAILFGNTVNMRVV